ncbi:hypothetical protein ACX3OZ_20285 [Devosia sp. A369]
MALDAVTVGIGFDSTALLAADLPAEPPTAKVYWPERNSKASISTRDPKGHSIRR